MAHREVLHFKRMQLTQVCKNVFDLSTDWDVPNTSGAYLVNSVTGVISTNITDTAAEGRRRLQGLATMRMLLSGTPSSATTAEEVSTHIFYI